MLIIGLGLTRVKLCWLMVTCQWPTIVVNTCNRQCQSCHQWVPVCVSRPAPHWPSYPGAMIGGLASLPWKYMHTEGLIEWPVTHSWLGLDMHGILQCMAYEKVNTTTVYQG